MNIHKLEPDVITRIKSSSTISSITHCITELVLNSLDAKSSAIALRINFVTFRIQVVDNGDGITKDNLTLLGQRYMTNKCSSLQLNKYTTYGFRGEALPNIIDMSKTVEICSKPKNSTRTWSRTFTKGTVNNVITIKDRPSYGTTVTIQEFLYNLPLRKKCVVPEVELFHVKRSIECLIIMHPHVSFSLRNDITGDLILNSQKCKNIISSFMALHPEVNDEYSLIKVSKSRVTIKGLLFKQMFENNSMQYMYVNKRPIKCSKLQVFINQLLQKNMKYSKEILRHNPVVLDEKYKHPAYVINITCSYFFVDILLSPKRSVVEFKNWDIVFCCIEKLVSSLFGKDNVKVKKPFINHKLSRSNCGVSQIYGALKSYGFKRKNNADVITSTPAKIQKLTNISKIQTGGKEFSVDKCSREDFNESKYFAVQNNYHHSELQNEKPIENTNDISDFSYKKYHFERNGSEAIEISPIVRLPKYETKKYLPPLPIKVLNKNILPKFNSEKITSLPKQTNIEYNHIKTADLCTKLETNKLLQEKSFLSKYTNDECKGKNLIMDMFLKSTQVYNSEDESDNMSGNTIMEMESKYFLENNITTNVNGKCKTMSVSVNITKRIKKKYKRSKLQHMTSKSIQTSLKNTRKMSNKCVQTSIAANPGYDSIDCENYLNKTKLVENCTVILTDEVPYFQFINIDRCQLLKPEIVEGDSNCNCKCHRNFLKSFNIDHFRNNVIKNNNIRYNAFYDMFHPTEVFQRNTKIIPKKYTVLQENKLDVEIPKKQSNTNIYSKTIDSATFCEDRSSYFYNMTDRRHIQKGIYSGNSFSHNERNMKQCYSFFNPCYKSTQKDNFQDKGCSSKNIQNEEHRKMNEDVALFHSFCSKFNTTDDISKFSDSFISEERFGCNRKTVNLSHDFVTQCPKEIDSNVLYSNLHKMAHIKLRKNSQHKDYNMLRSGNKPKSTYNSKVIPSDLEENLFITLSNQQKRNILERELSVEKKINKINLEWESQMAASNEKEYINAPTEFGCDWIQKQNNLGNNFYINRRTGFSTFYTPKISNKFMLSDRIDFVPKGLSPILKEIKKVDVSLSQNKKDKLQLYILESHQDELLKIKWQNYIKDNDPKTFFNEVYKEKLNSFENCIPRLYNNKKILELNPLFFSKTLLNNITVIGPVDKKFIAAIEETNNILMLFDQHAVHERIRLEQLLERYSNATVRLHGEKLMIFLSCNDIAILQKHEKYLNYLGLHVTFFQNGINVVDIPLCIYNKFNAKIVSKLLNPIIETLVKEILNLIKETDGVTFQSLPRMIRDIINLEACRGAIKFGDIITKCDCEQLLKQLSDCELPFQCAHGRPTLTPLLPLNFKAQIVPQKIYFQRLFP